MDKAGTFFPNFCSRPYFLMVVLIRDSFYVFVESNSGSFFGFEIIIVSREDISSLSAISQ